MKTVKRVWDFTCVQPYGSSTAFLILLLMFVGASALDMLSTHYAIMTHDGGFELESNPIAKFLFYRYGFLVGGSLLKVAFLPYSFLRGLLLFWCTRFLLI